MARTVYQDEQGQNLNRYTITPTDGSAAFTADLTRAANITQQGTPANAANLNQMLQVSDGQPVQVLSCAKSGTVYTLNGLTATSGIIPCAFQPSAAYVNGDTFLVNVGGTATAFAVVTSGGEALRSGAFLSGDIVGIHLDVSAQKLYIRQENAAQVGAVAKTDTDYIFRAYDNNTINIDSTPGNWTEQIVNGTSANGTLPWGNCHVTQWKSSDMWTQIADNNLSPPTIMFRITYGNNSWAPWRKIDAASADNASGAVPLTSPGLRNQVTNTADPSGGADGDTWDKV